MNVHRTNELRPVIATSKTPLSMDFTSKLSNEMKVEMRCKNTYYVQLATVAGIYLCPYFL